jgi:hypothetical protein
VSLPFTSDIGPIVTGRDVELAALSTLKRWSGTYLAELERRSNRTPGSLPRVRSWATAADFETWPEDQVPRVLVVSPGLAEEPQASGQGDYRAAWSLGFGVVVSAATMAETMVLAKLYTAALRVCLLQHQSLEGVAAGVEWLDESYDDLPSVDTRSLGAGQAIFAVQVDDVSRRWGGPVTPSDPPTPDIDPLPTDPYVSTVEIDVDRVTT